MTAAPPPAEVPGPAAPPGRPPVPWYMFAALAGLGVLVAPQYGALLVRTDFWCWVKGQCEYGAADWPKLISGAVLGSALLAAQFGCVLGRRLALVAGFGAVYLLVAGLTAYATFAAPTPAASAAVQTALLTAAGLIGGAHVAWPAEVWLARRAA